MKDSEKIEAFVKTIQDLRSAFYVAGKKSALMAAMERSKLVLEAVHERG